MMRIVCCLLVGMVLCCGCGKPRNTKKPELLIYCGITMIHPVSEIADRVAEQENCRIVVTKGGSGNLLKAIKTSQAGDVYLPGSDSYMTVCVEEKLVDETVFVGYNKAAMMVQRGNPKNITPLLKNLTDPQYYVVIGNPDSGSIGRETKLILENAGIYQQVLKNSRELTTDSKDLVRVLEKKQADLVVNWYATAFWPENRSYVDVLPLGEEYAVPKKLVMGRLVFSRYPDLAQKILSYAESSAGQIIFEKYGFIGGSNNAKE